LEYEKCLWQEIVALKYVRETPGSLIKPRILDSPVWSDLLKIRQVHLKGREYKLNSGKLMSFWLDTWMGKDPLCVAYPILYDLCLKQNSSVCEVAAAGWVVHFKIRLPPVLRDQWYELAAKLNTITLKDDKDEVRWKWSSSKKFTDRSVYQQLASNEGGEAFRDIWKAKIPLKIKIFMWMVAQKAILTKDNMIIRKWQGDLGCYFCGDDENIDHLLFHCPVAKVVRGIIAMCFHQRVRPIFYEQF
jgi:hypothetical protein